MNTIVMTNRRAPLALREDDSLIPPNRPTSGPEVDDIDPRTGISEADDFQPSKPRNPLGSGIDDGLLPGGNNFPMTPSKPTYPSDSGIDDGLLPGGNNFPMTPSKPTYPSDSGIDDGLLPGGNNFPMPEDPMIPDIGRRLPDINVYQQKKTLAQGMMDLALLSANANQLRYVLEAGPDHVYYYSNLFFIVTSIILQVSVGVLLLWNSRFNIKKEHHIVKANRINNFTVTGIFLITILNVFISAFGLPEKNPEKIQTV